MQFHKEMVLCALSVPEGFVENQTPRKHDFCSNQMMNSNKPSEDDQSKNHHLSPINTTALQIQSDLHV